MANSVLVAALPLWEIRGLSSLVAARRAVPQQLKIMQFQQDFCRKGTQGTQRQELVVLFLRDLRVLRGEFSFGCGSPPWVRVV